MLSREPAGNEAENLRGKVLCLVKKVPKTLSLISTLLALLLGFLGFYLGQNLDPIDALYLTIVTISTVGYGDISPSDACIDDEGNDISGSSACVGMRVFSVFYIIIGCGYVFAHLSRVFRGALEKFSNLVKRQIDKCSSTTVAIDTTGDGQADTKVTGRSVGLSGRSHDITGDGVADFVEPPTVVVYWAQELLPAILLVTVVQLVSALIYTVCMPELDVSLPRREPQASPGRSATHTHLSRALHVHSLAPRSTTASSPPPPSATATWRSRRPRPSSSRACTLLSPCRGWQH